jgi:hypothetical protein
MVTALGTDARNGRMLADPWSRAAHSMSQGWRIRLSQKPPGPRRETPRPTWKVFARLGVGILKTKASHAARTDWHRWAAARVVNPRRYVSKRQRLQSAPQCPPRT